MTTKHRPCKSNEKKGSEIRISIKSSVLKTSPCSMCIVQAKTIFNKLVFGVSTPELPKLTLVNTTLYSLFYHDQIS